MIAAPDRLARNYVHQVLLLEELEGHGCAVLWSEGALNVFLAHPAEAGPGTTMATDGVADPRERADLIAYLATLGDGPSAGSP